MAASGEGGLKGFNEYHALEALRRLREGAAGRPRLVRELGIGEASVKTLLRALRESGLAFRCGAAHCITELGRSVAGALEGLCLSSPANTGLTGRLSEAVVVMVPQLHPPTSVVEVYELRDYLVARHCKPVIVGGYWGPRTASFPGLPPELAAQLAPKVVEALEKSRCDMDVEASAIVVAPRECGASAAAALIAAVADSCSSAHRGS